jgi:ribokinase
MVDGSGNNSIVIVTGANDLMSDEEIESARPAMAEAGVVVCQLEIPVPAVVVALRAARAQGTRTILNPAPAPDGLPDELFGLSDVLCPNQGEAELLTGRPVKTVEDAVAAAAALRARGAGSVVVTLGEDGCLVDSPDGTEHVPAPTVAALDTTGAGDAFVGALAYFQAKGSSLVTSARWANEIAALSVLGRGTQTSFPERSALPDPVVQALER